MTPTFSSLPAETWYHPELQIIDCGTIRIGSAGKDFVIENNTLIFANEKTEDEVIVAGANASMVVMSNNVIKVLALCAN